MPGGGGKAMFMMAGEELGSRLKQFAGTSSSRAGGGGSADRKKGNKGCHGLHVLGLYLTITSVIEC